MINASAPGWIDKFFSDQKSITNPVIESSYVYYKKTRNTGFIYGYIVSLDTEININTSKWTEDEISKVALLNSLFGVYKIKTEDINSDNFIEKIVSFYNEMHPQGFNLLKKFLPNNPKSIDLENIIDERIQTNIDIINKQFSHVLTNALLFIDVLAFNYYLTHGSIPEKYIKKIEETIIGIVSLALKIKSNKSNYDDLLIKLLEASVRYSKFSNISIQNLEELKLDSFSLEIEKYYLIDLAGMALWSDEKIEKNEAFFLHHLAEIMSISEQFVEESIHDTNEFISKYKTDIPYFKYSNPVKHFFDHTTQNVEVLISRNKNRLFKEISESKELMMLLAKSTRRDLDEKEKKKIKKQLLDICKTIPSLTIFLLPGGSLLLPILIKFIPKLLPSAFNENLDGE
ncbi:MAG: hypothetical protein EBR38_02535 [Flavobacteriaceae bacterium]|jgi:hypothetical protein|nr:hypothetical protein [Flavobacteriaceae bacterium]